MKAPTDVISIDFDLLMLRHVFVALQIAKESGFDEVLDGVSLTDTAIQCFEKAAHALDQAMVDKHYLPRTI